MMGCDLQGLVIKMLPHLPCSLGSLALGKPTAMLSGEHPVEEELLLGVPIASTDWPDTQGSSEADPPAPLKLSDDCSPG